MANRGSLVSGSDFDSIGRKGGKGGGGGGSSSQDKIKIGVAVALLLVAGVILAWYYGLIDTTETPPPPTQEQIQAVEAEKVRIEEEVSSGRMATPGAE